MSLPVSESPVPATPLRVLLIAFEFAPLGAGGVQRVMGLARGLPAYGIDLDVVTVQAEDLALWSGAPVDATLLRALPESVRVHRIPSGFPPWYWSLTRGRAGFRVAQYSHWGDPVSLFWRRPLLEQLDALVAERRPDVLLATAPPFGVAVLGRIAARRYRLPWVADMRDAWSRWCVAPYPTIAHYLYARTHERAVLKSANVAVATSHVTRGQWLADTPSLSPGRMVTIYNGYDAAMVPAFAARRSVPEGSPEADLRHVVYAGSFYYTPDARAATFRPIWRRSPQHWLHYRLRREDWLYRSPYFFLRGIQRLRVVHPELARRLRVTFLGRVPPWLPPMLAETETADVVSTPGPVPHAEALRLERQADALLLTSAKVVGGRDYSIAGKVYEYFAAGVPILALLTDGAMRDLVSESGLGLLADPDDSDAVAEVLARVIAAPDPRRLVEPNEPFIAQFEHRLMAERMADCLRRAAAEGYRG
jgi:glycosyltransferase involved in cell wall biosynthesis